MTEPPAEPSHEPVDDDLDAPDAALAAAVVDDAHGAPSDDARFDLAGLAAEVGTTTTLLESLVRAGLLLPHHVDHDGVARYSDADARAVRAGLTLLDAGLPLGELLDLGRRTDAAVQEIAGHAVEAFLRFVRDPVRGTAVSDDEAAARLVTAYERMLPATEQLVAHHLRRRLLTEAAERIAREREEHEGGTADGGQEDAPAGAAHDGGTGAAHERDTGAAHDRDTDAAHERDTDGAHG